MKKNIKKYYSLIFIFLAVLALAMMTDLKKDVVSAAKTNEARILQNQNATLNGEKPNGYDSLSEAVKAARYEIERAGDNTLSAQNPANQMTAQFSADGNLNLSGTTEGATWKTAWELKSVGRGANQISVGGGKWRVEKNRTELRRAEAGLTEYFENRPEGLEQGFIIDEKPSGEENLRLVLQTSGEMKPQASADGRFVELAGDNGVMLRYEKLKVWDANGSFLVAAMSVENDKVMLDVEDSAAVYPVTVDPTFVNHQKISGNDSIAGDSFGSSIAVRGTRAVIGAPDDDISGKINQGSVYIFNRNGTVWTQTQKIIAADGEANDRFGHVVSIASDGKIYIGAPTDDVGAIVNQGSVYEFAFDSPTNTWFQNRKLLASDGGAGDNFGFSLAARQFVTVGSPFDDIGSNANQGSIYIFSRDNGTTEIDKATANDGLANDNFGYSIDELSFFGGNGVIVGSPLDDISVNSAQGSAYIFEYSSSTLIQRIKITAPDGAANDNFGSSVRNGCGDTGYMCVGAPNDDVGSNADQGSVYIFRYDSNSLTQQARLFAADGAAGDLFGSSLGNESAFSDKKRIVVGAPSDDVGANANQGSVYVFEPVNNFMTWNQKDKFTSNDGAANDNFGSSVAIYGFTIVAGAPNDDINANTDQGSAYVLIPRRAPFDFDGDGETDISIFRAGRWWIAGSDIGIVTLGFGLSTDIIVPADFTNDGKTDLAVFRPSNGQWLILRSENASFYGFTFGQSGDIPAPADYDGDGRADAAVFRPSNGAWYIQRSSDNVITIQQFGGSSDLPVPADYDGDGKADIAIYRKNGSSGGAEWWINRSTAGIFAVQFGTSTDAAVPGDYTGDGKTDVAFWRPSTGQWFILRSEDSSFFAFPFGTSGDVPVPGDYDGDGKTDAGVFRPSNTGWFIQTATSGVIIQQFGNSSDVLVPNAFVR